MTRVYNATKYSSREYVEAWALAKATKLGIAAPGYFPAEGDGNRVSYCESPSWYLTKLLWEAMDQTIASTSRAQQWFADVADVFAEHDASPVWTTPMGLPINKIYRKSKSKKLRTMIGPEMRQNSIRVTQKDIDHSKTKKAMAPNVIHSLDGACMMMSMNLGAASGITSFAAVHDSFATHAADSDLLFAAIREAYEVIFSQDQLGKVRDEFQSQLPEGVQLPPLPEYGNLDVSLVRKSQYFFN